MKYRLLSLAFCFLVFFPIISLSGQLSNEEMNVRFNSLVDDLETMDFHLFLLVLDRVKQTSLYKDNLDLKIMTLGAIDGMLRSVDPWSRLVQNRDKYEKLVNGEYSGIGITFKKKGRFIAIVSVEEKSPAEISGILPGDIVTRIQDQGIRGMKFEKAAKLFDGIVGTKIKIEIFRPHNATSTFLCEPEIARIVPKTVFWEVRSKIVLFRISEFLPQTRRQFMEAFKESLTKLSGVEGMILDLRNNPGGSVDAARDICAFLVGKGRTLFFLEDKEGKEPYLSDDYTNPFAKKSPFDGFPFVCLVNEGSASAAEIMAACLRDNLGVKLVGETTYGKGVGQTVTFEKFGFLAITTFRWLTPLGKSIQGEGLEPDLYVDPEDGFGNDPQMEKAIEIMDREIEVKNYRKRFFKKD